MKTSIKSFEIYPISTISEDKNGQNVYEFKGINQLGSERMSMTEISGYTRKHLATKIEEKLNKQ